MRQKKTTYLISGMENGHRIESRVLEEQIQRAVADGQRFLEVEAFGQQGIAGRLWAAGDDPVQIRIAGSPGQRTGSMGVPNTQIEILGPASDDVGWLNAGAEIIVHGHATNGVANAMAQGKIYVGGNIGARGMTMTKHNPRFEPPELWVLGSAGDYFAEFMAGGIAVICGFEPQDSENVLGFRPCVGMVAGRIYFRGPHQGFSQPDAKLIPLADQDWEWLTGNLRVFLERIERTHVYDEIAVRDRWQLLEARSPFERAAKARRSMNSFRQEVWDSELGGGGLIGDITKIDQSTIPVITTGDLRRYVPVWEQHAYLPPCEANGMSLASC